MGTIQIQWINSEASLKQALQDTLGCSGQLLKRYYSSKQLSRPLVAKELTELPLDLVNHLMIHPQYQGPATFIISDQSEYLVVHKPAGIHCHPLCYSDQNTLLNFLQEQKAWEALKVNAANYDRGLIYRLDFETSGVMLVAKTNEFHHQMRYSFELEMKQKFYWAIVKGQFDREGSWTHYFKATGIRGSKQKVHETSQGDSIPGILEVRKVLYLNGHSLLLINLKSGLRHQIRAQLSALGFPILGDELYGGIRAPRLFLHALRYEFSDVIEDPNAELFDSFFDLNRALQVTHDMIRIFKRS